ncbi:MAG: hypothetical protein CMN30_11615 [Sandaracinus sp.]|nr:hypothetical protein [Sandaracinus sp.]
MKRALFTVVLLALTACGESPDPGYLLNKARVLGALATVEGDATRSTPQPGETLQIEWVLDAPGPIPASTYFLVACTPSAQQFGAPVCGDTPFQVEVQTEPQETPPQITIPVPADYAADSVVILGAICMGGVVTTAIDPTSSVEELRPCATAEGVGQIVSASVAVQYDAGDRNLRPGIARVTLGGVELTEEVTESRQACAGGSLPEVRLDDEVMMTLEAVAGSRELYQREIPGADPEEVSEDLQNSLFVTEGTLDRRFTFVDDDTPVPDFEFLAEADSDDPLPAEGRTVKFIAVMRDRRGGVDVLRRGFCLVP